VSCCQLLQFWGVESCRTNEEHQSFGRCFLILHGVLAHAMDNWAYEINRENAILCQASKFLSTLAYAPVDVDQVEDHRNGKKTVAPELRHD
jgi:hypothetical protein